LVSFPKNLKENDWILDDAQKETKEYLFEMEFDNFF